MEYIPEPDGYLFCNLIKQYWCHGFPPSENECFTHVVLLLLLW